MLSQAEITLNYHVTKNALLPSPVVNGLTGQRPIAMSQIARFDVDVGIVMNEFATAGHCLCPVAAYLIFQNTLLIFIVLMLITKTNSRLVAAPGMG